MSGWNLNAAELPVAGNTVLLVTVQNTLAQEIIDDTLDRHLIGT